MEKELTLRMAVQLLGIDCDTSRRTVNIPCPICGKGNPKKKLLNINFDKYGPDDGAFRCPKCETSGRPLHFWALFRGLDMHDVKAAARDFYTYAECNADSVKVSKVQQIPKRIDVAPADIATRDRTYRGLLGLLQLNDSHKFSLIERGLSEDSIIANGYRSYPITGQKIIAEHLLSSGYVLKGVPGFYVLDDGSWTMPSFSNGFLIPQRNGFGQIQGMQLRLDNADSRGNRYFTISTGEKKNGSKGMTYCHLAKGIPLNLDDVILTEGPLKADIISQLTGYTVLAIPGVNATSFLKPALRDLKAAGLKKITIALDMDLYTNKYVQKALINLQCTLQDMQIPYTKLIWDKEYKGLDDWLQHNNNTGK